MLQLLGLWGPWWQQVCRDTDCLCFRSYGPLRVFFRASCTWQSEGLFGQSFSVAPPIQALRGAPWLGSYPVVQCGRHSLGQPLCCSAAVAAVVLAHRRRVTQQCCLAYMAAWLSSTGISHHSLFLHIHLFTVNSSPHPGIAPQS